MVSQSKGSQAGEDNLAIVHRFNAAFNRHDVDAVMALMTDDCVFENTYPPPDGERFLGAPAVRRFWERLFASPHSVFDWEEVFLSGDRSVVRWRYRWVSADGTEGHIRGVDILRLTDGKIAEKLSYVKG